MIHTDLLAIAKLAGCNVFLETGTCKGASLFRAVASGIFKRSYSCEIQETLYRDFVGKYPNNKKRIVYFGSSLHCLASDMLPKIATNEIPFFWLDAHYSEGPTGGADIPCPILEELVIIGKALKGRKAVIAIDDIDFLDHTDAQVKGHNWPSSLNVKSTIEQYFPGFVEIEYYSKRKVNNGVMVLAYKPVQDEQVSLLVKPLEKRERLIYWRDQKLLNPLKKKLGIPL